MESALVISDVQIPFQDQRALEVVMQVGEDLKPNRLVVNGDWMDFRNLSLKYGPRPLPDQFCKDAASEVFTAREHLETLVKRIKPKEGDFNEGNHEWRLFRALSHIPQVLQLMGIESVARALSIEALLGLEALGLKYSGEYPAGTWLFKRRPENNVFVHHSFITRKKAGYAGHAEIDTRLCSNITGHGERLALVWRRGMDRRLFAAEGGNLSILGEPKLGEGKYGSVPLNRPEFLDRQQGFVIVYAEGNDLFPFAVPIHHGKCLWNGRIYKA